MPAFIAARRIIALNKGGGDVIWILITGFWNDSGHWADNAVWVD